MKGPPVDASVKKTSSLAKAGTGVTVKSAVGPPKTKTSWVSVPIHPESEVTVKRTGYVPSVPKTNEGF